MTSLTGTCQTLSQLWYLHSLTEQKIGRVVAVPEPDLHRAVLLCNSYDSNMLQLHFAVLAATSHAQASPPPYEENLPPGVQVTELECSSSDESDTDYSDRSEDGFYGEWYSQSSDEEINDTDTIRGDSQLSRYPTDASDDQLEPSISTQVILENPESPQHLMAHPGSQQSKAPVWKKTSYTTVSVCRDHTTTSGPRSGNGGSQSSTTSTTKHQSLDRMISILHRLPSVVRLGTVV
jgi:hypothetical protein